MFTKRVGVKIEKTVGSAIPIVVLFIWGSVKWKDFPLLWSTNKIFSNSQILLLCLLVELYVIIEVSEHFLFFFLLSLGWKELIGQQGIFQGWKHLPVFVDYWRPCRQGSGVWHRDCAPTTNTWRRGVLEERSWKSCYFLHLSSFFFFFWGYSFSIVI